MMLPERIGSCKGKTPRAIIMSTQPGPFLGVSAIMAFRLPASVSEDLRSSSR